MLNSTQGDTIFFFNGMKYKKHEKNIKNGWCIK